MILLNLEVKEIRQIHGQECICIFLEKKSSLAEELVKLGERPNNVTSIGMKRLRVLSYAWYIYDPSLKPFNKNYTGGGLVVRNLRNYIGKHHESYLFLGQVVEPGRMVENINIVKTEYDITQKMWNIVERYMDLWNDEKHRLLFESLPEMFDVLENWKPDRLYRRDVC